MKKKLVQERMLKFLRGEREHDAPLNTFRQDPIGSLSIHNMLLKKGLATKDDNVLWDTHIPLFKMSLIRAPEWCDNCSEMQYFYRNLLKIKRKGRLFYEKYFFTTCSNNHWSAL